MKPLKIIGKFLDQPLLVAKFKQKVPYVLVGGGVVYTANEVRKCEPEKRKETLLRSGTTMVFTVISALAAPAIVNKIFKTANILKIFFNSLLY